MIHFIHTMISALEKVGRKPLSLCVPAAVWLPLREELRSAGFELPEDATYVTLSGVKISAGPDWLLVAELR